MRIQIINENTAKCYLNIEELEEMDISIEELKRNIKENRMEKDMMNKFKYIVDNINNELVYNGQEPFIKNSSLVSLHIVVMSNNTLELTINTKQVEPSHFMEEDIPIEELEELIENNEDLPPMPKFLENLFKSMLGMPVDWEEYDENYNLEQSKANKNHIQEQYKEVPLKEINTKTKKEEKVIKQNYLIYSFYDMNKVFDFVKVLPNIEKSSFLKYKENYYLMIDDLKEQHKKQLDYIACEFYEENDTKPYSIEFIKEHSTILIEREAIEKLKRI